MDYPHRGLTTVGMYQFLVSRAMKHATKIRCRSTSAQTFDPRANSINDDLACGRGHYSVGILSSEHNSSMVALWLEIFVGRPSGWKSTHIVVGHLYVKHMKKLRLAHFVIHRVQDVMR